MNVRFDKHGEVLLHGEHKALEISQSYLSQLLSLEQWAAEYDLSYDQFQASLEQWQAEYELAMAQFQTSVDQWKAEYDLSLKQYETDKDLSYGQLTGTIPSTGELTLNGQSQLASMGEALLSAGIMPNSQQLSAMGMTESQAQAYLTAQQLQQASGSYSSGGKTGSTTDSNDDTESQTGYDALFEAAKANGYLKSYIYNHYKEYGFTSSTGMMEAYEEWLAQQEKAGSDATGTEAGLGDLNTASILSLGLGALSYAAVESMVQQGVLTVYDAGSKLGVKWADGWSAEKYKNSMKTGTILLGIS